MKSIITISFLFFSFCIKAQLFSGPGGNILNDGQKTYFNLSVAGLSPSMLDSTFGVEEVCINMMHPRVQQLYIYLQSPSGMTVELTEATSSNDTGYVNTCFNSSSPSSITLGISPYTGVFRPIGFLGRFQNGQTGNGTWRLIVHDYLSIVDSGTVINWSINFGNTPAPAVKLFSSNLPIVVVNTGGLPISDVEIIVNMGIIYNGTGIRNNITDPLNNYNGYATINIRGNSSKSFEKKPYSIETSDVAGNSIDASLLGMPPENDWCLLAMYQDKSFIRGPLTFEISQRMGHYASRYKLVEVVINGEYQGIYALIEKPKRNNNRIDISKLTPTENSAPGITGGYIFKIDRTDEAGWNSLLPGDPSGTALFYYQYVYPKDTAITIPQKAYIKDFMDDFETLMNSASFNSAVGGYRDYIDVGSFVDYFIINELSKNVDAYRLSTYLYKDHINDGGKLHIGPVWDYDLAWHNCNYANTFDPAGWQYQLTDTTHPTPNWWNRFLQDTTFVNELYCRWNYLRQNILSFSSLNTFIDSTATMLNESQQRNYIQWPTLGAYIWPNPQNQVGANYLGEVDDLKNWIASRAAWMDGAILGYCLPVGINESPENNLAVYPNPFSSSTTFEIVLFKGANVTLKIVDVMGKEVAELLDEYKSSGELKVTFDRNSLASGIYFYQLQIDDSIKTGKLIIN